MKRYVIDTHSLLWYLTDDDRLGSNALTVMIQIDQNKAKGFIPSIVLAEAIFILEKKKIQGVTFQEIMEGIQSSSNYFVIDLDWQILTRIASFRAIPEIHDRIIVVTAKIFDAVIVSKDETIRNVVKSTIW